MSEPMIDWLNAQQQNIISLLADLVNIDSNSFDKVGVDKVADRLQAFFDNHGIPHETIPLKDHGDALRAVVSAYASFCDELRYPSSNEPEIVISEAIAEPALNATIAVVARRILRMLLSPKRLIEPSK